MTIGIAEKLNQQSVSEISEEAEKMASGLHGEIGTKIIAALANFVYPRDLGRVFNAQTSFRVQPDLPSRQPDAAFVTAERMPEEIDEDVPFAPDLAVEVISRSDDWSEISRKARGYLQAGTRLVWSIDPYERSVFVFRSEQLMQMLNLEDELDGGDVLPGFKLLVKDLFPKQKLRGN